MCMRMCGCGLACVHAEKGRVADAGGHGVPEPMAVRAPRQLHVKPVVAHAGAAPLAATVPAPLHLARGLRALHVHASSCRQRTQAACWKTLVPTPTCCSRSNFPRAPPQQPKGSFWTRENKSESTACVVMALGTKCHVLRGQL